MSEQKISFIESISTVDEDNNLQLTAKGCKISAYVLGTIAIGSAVASGVTLMQGQEAYLPAFLTIGTGAMSYVSYRASQDKVKEKTK